MVFEKNEVLISSQNKKLLKLYISFVIIDIIGILLIKNFFGELNVLRYTVIRVLFISFSITISALKYLFALSSKLLNAYKIVLAKEDPYVHDDEDGVSDQEWETIKNILKIIWAIIEVSILFGAQAKASIHFRERIYDAGAFNILICLILMGTLLYLCRSYINKKYCI